MRDADNRLARIMGDADRAKRTQSLFSKLGASVRSGDMDAILEHMATVDIDADYMDKGRADVEAFRESERESIRCHLLLGGFLYDLDMETANRECRHDDGEIFGPWADALISRGSDWMLSMLGAFAALFRERLRPTTSYKDADRPERHNPGGGLTTFMALAMDSVMIPDGHDMPDPADPDGFGRALADAWIRLMDEDVATDDSYLFPSADMLAEWRGITASGIIGSRNLPLCLCGNGMMWIAGCVGGHGFLPDWLRRPSDAVVRTMLSAFGTDGGRDYSDVISFAGAKHGLLRPEISPNGFAGALEGCDRPARVLGILDVLDVLVLAAGGDPSCPNSDIRGPVPWDSGDYEAKSTNRRGNRVPVAVVSRIAHLLEQGCPKDMAAESALYEPVDS